MRLAFAPPVLQAEVLLPGRPIPPPEERSSEGSVSIASTDHSEAGYTTRQSLAFGQEGLDNRILQPETDWCLGKVDVSRVAPPVLARG